MILDLETATRTCPGNGCFRNYQKFYRKHLSSINLIKTVFFFHGQLLQSFLKRLSKCLCRSVPIKKAHDFIQWP